MIREWLAPLHLVITLIILGWSVVLGGRIANNPQSPRIFAALSGLAALLLVPATLIGLASSTLVTGRTVALVDWMWPAVLVLFAAQAIYASSRQLVNPFWGYAIMLYDIVIAIAGIVKYLSAHGVTPPQPLLVFTAAVSDALMLGATSAALHSPLYFLPPMISPAFPALRRITASFRAGLAAIAFGWSALIAAELPLAERTLASYARHEGDRLQERPEGDFEIGLKIFPDMRSAPPVTSLQSDLDLADTLKLDVVSVVVVPDVAPAALDSVARALDELRRDSTTLIVTLGYRGVTIPQLGRGRLDTKQRLAAIDRILRRLRPDILVPAQDPYGVGARALGRLPVRDWEEFVTEAALLSKRLRPATRIGLAASAYDTRDSALYAWAAAPGSPVDIPGFSLYPERTGARAVDAYTRAADRWMRATPPTKDHWIFGVGGYPLAHGEASQELLIWSALAWGTSRPAIKGLIVQEAGDYGSAMGLRAPDGRLRRATFAIIRAGRGLTETSNAAGKATVIAK
ncbi:MAG: hypothetical protein JWO05_2121 [Gemmatimonadetes bacterium]|nr:hypothetical protein [Gemmatimonadota bacterium]